MTHHPAPFTSSFRRMLLILLFIAFLIGSACTILGFFGQYNWRLDLLSHFRLQYMALFSVLLVFSLVLHSRELVFSNIVLLLVNAVLFLPFYIPQKPVSGTELSVMSANVQRDNKSYQLLLQEITETQPEIIVLTEYSFLWEDAMQPLRTLYPYSVSEARSDFSGIALFSKIPLTDPHIAHIGGSIPSVVASLTKNQKTVTIIGSHPLPPFGKRSSMRRDEQLKATGEFINNRQTPTLLIGDLNTTIFGHSYRELLKHTSLQNCANGYGYRSTWQRTPFMPPFGIKIDHCLHTPGIAVAESRVGKDIGSDHLPIFNKLTLL